MQIAVISDTHDVLREEVLKQIRMADAVIHAGDVCNPDIVEQIRANLQKDAGFYLVRGNADGAWAKELPETLEFAFEQVRIFVVHDRKKTVIPDDCDIVICGHTHKFQAETMDGRLFLNPGGCGRRRFRLELTMAVLYIDGKTWRVEKIALEEPVKQSVETGKENLANAAVGIAEDITASAGEKECTPVATEDTSGRENAIDPLELSSGELLHLIEKILRGMKRGKNIPRIAGELNMEPSFVDEICRIYVTHPGVTANGILDKLEVNRHIGA
ncbi:MAG: metallophosphatase family protein [Lachnospiraceae bacterium]|nr:metallophosphatase family protein [Lachnospiraceae bacterium]